MSAGGENLLLTKWVCAYRLCCSFHLNPPRLTVQLHARKKCLALDVSLEPECSHHGISRTTQHTQRVQTTLDFVSFRSTLHAHAERPLLLFKDYSDVHCQKKQYG